MTTPMREYKSFENKLIPEYKRQNRQKSKLVVSCFEDISLAVQIGVPERRQDGLSNVRKH